MALVFTGRALWLATRPPVPRQSMAAQTRDVAADRSAADAPADQVDQSAPSSLPCQRLSSDEYEALLRLCPTAIGDLPAEWLPESAAPPTAQGPPAAPRGRLTGVRIASRAGIVPSAVDPPIRVAQAPSPPTPAPLPDGWLVSPDEWYAPEDPRPAAESEAAEASPTPDSPQKELPGDSGPRPPAPEQPSEPQSAAESAATSTPSATEKKPTGPPIETDAAEKPYPATDNPTPGQLDPPAEPALPSGRWDVSPWGSPAAEPGEAQAAAPPLGSPVGEEAPAPPGTPAEQDPGDLPAAEPVAPVKPSLRDESRAPAIPKAAPPSNPLPGSADTSEAVPSPTQPERPVPPAFTPAAPPVGSSPAAPVPDARPSLPQPPAPHGRSPQPAGLNPQATQKSADESHRELFAKNCYPSALDCADCHKRIYDEWSVSSHAYSFVSPMYHKFEETISRISQGTVGHFCQRCHSPVATAMYEPRSTPIGEMAVVAREGVTCIVCHRVNQRWGRSNGERRIVPGDRYAPVYGGVGGDGVAAAIADKKGFKVKTSDAEKGPGQAIHNEGRFFDQLTQAEACTSCHQVAVQPGIKLEVVWEQYRASPACKKGVTCQECHMGRVPGMAGGYNYGPIAELNGKTVNNHRKQSSHLFYGPGYSVAHPGIFPQNKDAADWTVDEWLAFDWRAGWGTDEFEEQIEAAEDGGANTAAWFPKVWSDADDRCDAREVIQDNLDRLAVKRRYREIVMENGSKVDGPFFREQPTAGRDLVFDYVVTNQNEGHNLPTASLGAQPQFWANVVLIGPDGRRLWETGYTDSKGDLCDIHSEDVRHGRLPFDKQLFNLQTMFLITGATGTDREFYLPVNIDFDQVPHLRPGNIPYSVSNHPPFIRMESRSIGPLGRKKVKYTIPGELLCRRGKYRLSFRLRSRTEPMFFMRFCDATPEMLRAMVEGTLDIHPQSVEFEVR